MRVRVANPNFRLLPHILSGRILLSCGQSANTNVAVLFAPPAEYRRVWPQNDLGINLWRKSADRWILLEAVSARQGDARVALISSAGMIGLLGLLKDIRPNGFPRSVPVCGNRSGMLMEMGGVSTTGQKLEGTAAVIKIGVWRYVATYFHPKNEASDRQADQAILNVCRNPNSHRSLSSKPPE